MVIPFRVSSISSIGGMPKLSPEAIAPGAPFCPGIQTVVHNGYTSGTITCSRLLHTATLAPSGNRMPPGSSVSYSQTVPGSSVSSGLLSPGSLSTCEVSAVPLP